MFKLMNVFGTVGGLDFMVVLRKSGCTKDSTQAAVHSLLVYNENKVMRRKLMLETIYKRGGRHI